MSEGRLQVAVVDDDPSFLRALERLLRAAGYHPRAFPSGEAFLEEHSTRHWNCAVIDVQLGSMTGFEVAQRLQMKKARIPVIFITAHDDPGWQQQAVAAGCVAYIRKPFAARLLFEAVREATLAQDSTPETAGDPQT